MRALLRSLPSLAALLLLFGGAGCGDRREPLPAETDEAYFVQGKQLMKQGRNPEALNAFLKVIDRRGERGAPESHLEAAHLYLYHTKDPVEAYHHFRRYLVLRPNAREAEHVRGMVVAALREFARTLPTRPLDDQSARLEVSETMERLRRENEELRAQIATLRGGGGAPGVRSAPMITLPEDPAARSPASSAAVAASPATNVPARPAPPAAPPAVTTPATKAAAPAGTRTHTVRAKETMFGISVQYYGHGRGTGAIYQANRDSMRHETDLRPGMVLRIPPLDGGAAGRR